MRRNLLCSFFFFFNDTATTEIYTLSLHDALPIFIRLFVRAVNRDEQVYILREQIIGFAIPNCAKDRKSTRLNSSHGYISYAVFCLKKKKNQEHCSDYNKTQPQCAAADCRPQRHGV